jgi:hypothetical protein
MQQLLIVSVVACVLLAPRSDGATGDTYSIGTGRYDITGPAVEINMVRVWQQLATKIYSSS